MCLPSGLEGVSSSCNQDHLELEGIQQKGEASCRKESPQEEAWGHGGPYHRHIDRMEEARSLDDHTKEGHMGRVLPVPVLVGHRSRILRIRNLESFLHNYISEPHSL